MWSVKFIKDTESATRGNLAATWTGSGADTGFVFVYTKGGVPSGATLTQFATAANAAKATARTAWLASQQVEIAALAALNGA